MDKRYCVKFIRCDRAVPAVEEYYYWDRSDAYEYKHEWVGIWI